MSCSRRCEHAANNLGGQRLRLGLQSRAGGIAILLNILFRDAHLRLSVVASLGKSCRTGFQRGFAASLLLPE